MTVASSGGIGPDRERHLFHSYCATYHHTLTHQLALSNLTILVTHTAPDQEPVSREFGEHIFSCQFEEYQRGMNELADWLDEVHGR